MCCGVHVEADHDPGLCPADDSGGVATSAEGAIDVDLDVSSLEERKNFVEKDWDVWGGLWG